MTRERRTLGWVFFPTMYSWFRTSVLLAAVLLSAVPISSQVSEGWHDTVVLDTEDLGDPTTLVKDWRYHPGDDPVWADPAFDDSGWSLLLPSLENVDGVPGGWPGIGWFRRQIVVTEEFGPSLGTYTAQAGASEIYLDGVLLARFGEVSADATIEQVHMPQYVEELMLPSVPLGTPLQDDMTLVILKAR